MSVGGFVLFEVLAVVEFDEVAKENRLLAIADDYHYFSLGFLTWKDGELTRHGFVCVQLSFVAHNLQQTEVGRNDA